MVDRIINRIMFLLKDEVRKLGLTSYKDVGINRGVVEKYHKAIGPLIASTHSNSTGVVVLPIIGHYAGLIEIGSGIFALHSDGVGTKVIIAQLMRKYDTIGIDCIAMNANDVICVGARPIAFIDYIALKSSNNTLVKEILKGLVKGARYSEVPIVGGETAILPDIISGVDETYAFDLAGTVLGLLETGNRPILGTSIQTNDVILGIESSGLHSNGYTLARKILLSRYSLKDQPSYMSKSLGEELLVPTRIYVKPVLEILKSRSSITVHGLAHITGGSFTKLLRLNKRRKYSLTNLPPPFGIFKQIAADGPVDLKEMYRTFNMGIGFCLIAPRESISSISKIFRRHRMSCVEIGNVEGTGKGEVSAILNGKRYLLAR
jgi:phosphoribosylformylglycinamidine cyclo-ligase